MEIAIATQTKPSGVWRSETGAHGRRRTNAHPRSRLEISNASDEHTQGIGKRKAGEVDGSTFRKSSRPCGVGEDGRGRAAEDKDTEDSPRGREKQVALTNPSRPRRPLIQKIKGPRPRKRPPVARRSGAYRRQRPRSRKGKAQCHARSVTLAGRPSGRRRKNDRRNMISPRQGAGTPRRDWRSQRVNAKRTLGEAGAHRRRSHKAPLSAEADGKPRRPAMKLLEMPAASTRIQAPARKGKGRGTRADRESRRTRESRPWCSAKP